jgi:hypothetical protein
MELVEWVFYGLNRPRIPRTLDRATAGPRRFFDPCLNEEQDALHPLDYEQHSIKSEGNFNHWQKNQRPPPKPKTLELQIDYSFSQLLFYEDQDLKRHAPGTGNLPCKEHVNCLKFAR